MQLRWEALGEAGVVKEENVLALEQASILASNLNWGLTFSLPFHSLEKATQRKTEKRLTLA